MRIRGIDEKRADVECIQTGEKNVVTDIGVLTVVQSVYGQINSEVFLDLFSFVDLESEDKREFETLPYTNRVALDEIGVRKLIKELAEAFHLEVDLLTRNRM